MSQPCRFIPHQAARPKLKHKAAAHANNGTAAPPAMLQTHVPVLGGNAPIADVELDHDRLDRHLAARLPLRVHVAHRSCSRDRGRGKAWHDAAGKL